MDLKEISISTRSCVDSAQDRDYWRALLTSQLLRHGTAIFILQDNNAGGGKRKIRVCSKRELVI